MCLFVVFKHAFFKFSAFRGGCFFFKGYFFLFIYFSFLGDYFFLGGGLIQ